MTKNNDTALLPVPENREIWTFSEAEKLCAWYSENFETISLVLHNTRPAAPQNAEALGACDHIEEANNCHISVRGYYCFDPIHLDKIRADLNQPRTPKIDGLREAIENINNPNRKFSFEDLCIVEQAARAYLVAQEEE